MRTTERKTALARDMRLAPTESERILWEALRNRQADGARFRRQRPIDRYIADFCCDAARLVVEIDGGIHSGEDQREYDILRDNYLKAIGYRILRFKVEEVMRNLPDVLSRILAELRVTPSPLAGEGAGGEVESLAEERPKDVGETLAGEGAWGEVESLAEERPKDVGETLAGAGGEGSPIAGERAPSAREKAKSELSSLSKGVFITLEGPEGAGKSFHSSRLACKLESIGWETVQTREPGGTPAAEMMRAIALETALPPRAELLLFLSARAEHVETVIRPALARGATVVCDRFIDSTVAYQGYGLGLDAEKIRDLNDYATDHLTPDLTLVLDVPPEVGFARRGEARRDQIEKRRNDFHHRLRDGFLEEAKRFPERIRVIDATREPEETFQRVWFEVESLLNERNLR